MAPSVSHLLVNSTEVLHDVVHAAFLQLLTGVSLSEAVNPHTVHFIHLILHEMTTGLSDSHEVQQVSGCLQCLDQIEWGWGFKPRC